MILETALIRGGKTLFIAYNRRFDAELAKSDSKILKNCPDVKFSQEENSRSGNTVNETDFIQTFAEYGAVRRVEFIRDNRNNIFGEVFVYFSNTAAGQISAL
ncbi:MAG: hypothetical protein EZS28_050412 [Streblomastix strix]|uniref:RRM domain-containing protein n=1 Tax=Streblomastix strix TaxID=222440 RepID=A0A5J4T8M6_9EUKA|nr:MAG: hypothetical protein EZS28_050412 [Streblomastix strix]